MNTTYQYRKENGLCVFCGKTKATGGRVTCDSCREKTNKANRETREYLKRIHVCPKCGKNKLVGDKKTCPECLRHLNERNKRR